MGMLEILQNDSYQIPEIEDTMYHDQDDPEKIISFKDHLHLNESKKVIPPSLLNHNPELEARLKKMPSSTFQSVKMVSYEANLEEMIFTHISRYSKITLKDLIQLAKLDKPEAKKILRKLTKEKKLERFGRFSLTFYKKATIKFK